LFHAGSASGATRFAFPVRSLGYHFFQQGKDPLTQGCIGINVLQAAQELGNVIARLRIEDDGGNIGFTEFELGLNDGTNTISSDEDFWLLGICRLFFARNRAKPDSEQHIFVLRNNYNILNNIELIDFHLSTN
jgi:hypothetical protein